MTTTGSIENFYDFFSVKNFKIFLLYDFCYNLHVCTF